MVGGDKKKKKIAATSAMSAAWYVVQKIVANVKRECNIHPTNTRAIRFRSGAFDRVTSMFHAKCTYVSTCMA